MARGRERDGKSLYVCNFRSFCRAFCSSFSVSLSLALLLSLPVLFLPYFRNVTTFAEDATDNNNKNNNNDKSRSLEVAAPASSSPSLCIFMYTRKKINLIHPKSFPNLQISIIENTNSLIMYKYFFS